MTEENPVDSDNAKRMYVDTSALTTDIRAAVEAYTKAFPRTSPVISLRILTETHAIKEGDIQLYLSDPKNPGLTHATATGWTVREAAANLRKHLQSRLVAVADEQAKKLLAITTSMESDRQRLVDAAKLAWSNG